MEAEDILYLALADATAQLRADRPDWFLIVDEIKARPGWEPFADAWSPKVRAVKQAEERGHPFPRLPRALAG